MKGLASPYSMTGKLQRALTDEWQTQSQIITRAEIPRAKWGTVEACLARLVGEQRAAMRHTPSAQLMWGRTEYKNVDEPELER